MNTSTQEVINRLEWVEINDEIMEMLPETNLETAIELFRAGEVYLYCVMTAAMSKGIHEGWFTPTLDNLKFWTYGINSPSHHAKAYYGTIKKNPELNWSLY